MRSTPNHSAITIQLLEWISERPRTYLETIDAWKSSCPRLTIWEDALADGLVCVRGRSVLLTPAGVQLVPVGDNVSPIETVSGRRSHGCIPCAGAELDEQPRTAHRNA